MALSPLTHCPQEIRQLSCQRPEYSGEVDTDFLQGSSASQAAFEGVADGGQGPCLVTRPTEINTKLNVNLSTMPEENSGLVALEQSCQTKHMTTGGGE